MKWPVSLSSSSGSHSSCGESSHESQSANSSISRHRSSPTDLCACTAGLTSPNLLSLEGGRQADLLLCRLIRDAVRECVVVDPRDCRSLNVPAVKRDFH